MDGQIDQLVLSLFPGIGLLDMAFEEAGFCVVRGPDQLWGGDIHRFHPPAGRFDGVIGGPPCQAHSVLSRLARHRWGSGSMAPDLIPEFVRCIEAAEPIWFLMENVPGADLVMRDYHVSSLLVNNRCFGGAQHRVRRFWFGHKWRPISLVRHLNVEIFENPTFLHSIMASGVFGPDTRADLATKSGPSWATVGHSLEAQGLPPDFFTKRASVFTARGAQKMIGNGVPLPMGREIAAAVRRALECDGSKRS